MEGLTTTQAKEQLLEILSRYKQLNKQKPVRNVHLYFGSSWACELVVCIYAAFLVCDFAFISGDLERLIVGLLFMMFPLRFLYYRANRSKFHFEKFNERMKDIKKLIKQMDSGEDLTHRSYRSHNDTMVEVLRDNKWAKLPCTVLLEGDIVKAKPGGWFPAGAEGLTGHYLRRCLAPYEVIQEEFSDDVLQAKQKIKFRLKSSPIEEVLQKTLDDRIEQKTRATTFYMLCLEYGNKFVRTYCLSALVLNALAGVFWALMSDSKWNDLLSNPSVLFLAVIPLLLPSLVNFLTCWGNAVMWCICDSLDRHKSKIAQNVSNVEHLASILKIPPKESSGAVFDMNQIAEKAEEDFDDREMMNLIPAVKLSACLSKCRSFLIGGLQRDSSIVDIISSTSFLCFADKEGIISENAKYIDELVVMGPDNLIPLDLMHKSPLDIISGQTDHDQIAFVESRWVDYKSCLKPLGLALSVSRNPRFKDNRNTLVNLNEDHPDTYNTGELFFAQPKEEIEIFEDCVCVLARLIGFTEASIQKLQHKCTLWSTWRPTYTDNLHELSYKSIRAIKRREKKSASVVADTADKRITQMQRTHELKNRLLRPCHLLTSIVQQEGGYQVMSQGHPRVILQNCTDYWDGNNIVVLEEADRQRLNTLLMQWTADNYDTIAYSYKPLVKEKIINVVNDSEALNRLDERTKDLLQEAQRKQIFLGMVAITNHAKPEANHFIEDTFEAGMRFVIFSEGNYLETKAFGDDLGLYTAWNSCISLSDNSEDAEQLNQAGAQVLPRGIRQVKEVLHNNIDTVPLLVSMFSDANKKDMLEMIKLYQQFGEVVTVIGGCLHPQNLDIYRTADVSVGMVSQPCGFCSTCNGMRIFYEHRAGVLELVSEQLVSLCCTFTLGPQASLYLILQVIKEARKFMVNLKNGLLFTVVMYVSWSFSGLAGLFLGFPPFLSPVQCVYIALIVIPSLALSFLATPSEPKLMKKLPIKTVFFNIKDHYWFFANRGLMILWFVLFIVCLHLWQIQELEQSTNMHFFQWVAEDTQIEVFKVPVFMFGVLVTVVFSSGFVIGHHTFLCRKPMKNKWWLAVCLGNLVLAFAICVIYIEVYDLYGDFGKLVEKSVLAYVVCFVVVIISFFGIQLLNWDFHRHSKKLQGTLQDYFETKLGLYSPK